MLRISSFVLHARRASSLVLLLGVALGSTLPGRAQQAAPATSFTLEQAQAMALAQNRRLGIAREQVTENQYKVAETRAKYFPQVSATAVGGYNTNKLDITIPRGALGVYPGTGPIPGAEIPLVQGSHTNLFGAAQVIQPLTQLAKVRTGVQLGQADVQLAQTQVRQAEWEVRQGVEKLYYGVLLAEQQQQQLGLALQAAQRQRYDTESARLAGKALPAQLAGADANIANLEQKQVAAQNQLADYSADLCEVLGLAPDIHLALVPPPLPAADPPALATYLARADTANLDNRQARQQRAKAALGVKYARQQYLPDVALTASYVRVQGSVILPPNSVLVGGLLNWNIYDFGGRRAVVNQRLSQQKQAAENELYTKEHVGNEVQKAYRQLRQAATLVAAAQKAVTFRAEELKIKEDAQAAGKALPTDVLATQATLAQARADLLSAQLNYRLAYTALERLGGQL